MTAFDLLAQEKYRDDVSSIDGIINALYSSISGASGEKRDWKRFEYIHIEGAKLLPTQMNEDGSHALNVYSPSEYVDNFGSMLEERGFYETEIHRLTETFGSITHVWSTYEARWGTKDSKPFTRGINSIQLLNDGKRWYIVNIFWTNETDDHTLPERYLPK